MRLDTYINDLLYRYDCVIVPKFGAFLTQYSSAILKEDTNSFFAPQKKVSFNEQINTNDGILANYVADVLNIDYTTAVEKINDEVNQLKTKLNNQENLVFEGIGELSFNTENNIYFKPSNKTNFLATSFGLSSVNTTNITRETTTQKAVETAKVTPVIAIDKSKPARKSYRNYAAVGLLALGLIGIAGSKLYFDEVQNHNEIAQQEANKTLEAKVQKATFIIDNPLPAATISASKQTGNYHLVAGAFRVEENCNKKLEQLKKEGYNATRIGINKHGLHQIAYGSYKTRNEAQQQLNKLRASKNINAWLLFKKLD